MKAKILQLWQRIFAKSSLIEERGCKNRNPSAYHITTEASSSDTISASTSSMSSQPIASTSSMSSQPVTQVTTTHLSPEMVQQTIINDFSTLGLLGKNPFLFSLWYVDCRASNNMTFSFANLSKNKKYDGNLQVHTQMVKDFQLRHR